MYGFGDSQPIVGPISTAAPSTSTPYASGAPAGYWTNPQNSTQWLTQADAAKLGGWCFQAPGVAGKYRVGGNGSNTVLFCGSIPCQDDLLIYGGLAAALFLLAPGGWKWAGLLPAGYAALACTLGQVAI